MHIDPLEPRRLLSVVWTNRGKDNFDRFYGTKAPLARQLVDAAIADWNSALPKASVKVKISAANLEPGSKHPNLLGHTTGTTVSMDSNAADQRWYFDPDLNEDSDVLARRTADNSIRGSADSTVDFYTAVLHELGHALGFSDKQNPAHIQVGANKFTKDPTHSGYGQTLMVPFADTRFRAYVTPYEASHTRFAKTGLANPTRGTFFSAASSDGHIVISPPPVSADPSDSVTVYRVPADQPDATPTLVATFSPAAATPTVDPDPVVNVAYRYYAVVTRNFRGQSISFTPPDSQTITLTPGASVVTSKLSFGPGTTAVSTLTWTPYPGADHYEIYRTIYSAEWWESEDAPPPTTKLTSDIADGYAKLVGTVPGSESTFVDPRPSDDGHDFYRYWVIAYLPTGPGESLTPYIYPGSSTGFVNFKLPDLIGNGPNHPAAAGQPTLQWSAPTTNLPYLDQIEIWRSPDTDTTDRLTSGASLIAFLPNTATSFTDPSATPGTTYRYWFVLRIHTTDPSDPAHILPFPTLNSVTSYTLP